MLKGGISADKQSCSGDTINVSASGHASLNIAPWDAVAIHHNARLETTNTADWRRTVIFIQAQTSSGQDMFVRGGIDHDFAASQLGLNCTSANYLCAMPIRHNNMHNATTAPWKENEQFLDWYGAEANQSSDAEGTALDWTTDVWPASWGDKKTVAVDGYGEEPLNIWGQHYWMLDVEMDCSKSVNGWFELKAYVKNGQGWEGDIQQSGTPYSSNNHFAQCGKINQFDFNGNGVQILDF